MTDSEKSGLLAGEFRAVIHRAFLEYDGISFAAVIGALEIVKLELFLQQRDADTDEDRNYTIPT